MNNESFSVLIKIYCLNTSSFQLTSTLVEITEKYNIGPLYTVLYISITRIINKIHNITGLFRLKFFFFFVFYVYKMM